MEDRGKKKGVSMTWLTPFFSNMPEGGIEPPQGCPYWILSPARLPVPPLRLKSDFSQALRRVSREMRNAGPEI